MMEDNNLILALLAAVIDGDDVQAARLAETALNAGLDPLALVKDGIQPALEQIGQQFQSGQLFLPELILAGDAAAAALNIIKPRLISAAGGAASGKVVIGTIQGDLHDIGKNVVAALLTAHGLQVVDLGTDVTPKKYVEAASREKAQIIAISSLLTTALPYHEDVVRLLQDLGQRQNHFVIVGGGPVNPQWAAKIGADGYGRDAQDAVKLCQALMETNEKPPLKQPLCFGTLK
jgi:5-methyltetrahydrofolate--homocysteine methyltransferase